jgi:hypothetical protein
MGELLTAIQIFKSFGLGAKKNTPKENIAQFSLQHNMSYRLDATASNDRWIGLREWYRHGIKTNGSSVFFIYSDTKSTSCHALITGNQNKNPQGLKYVQKYHNIPVTHYAGKDLTSLQHVKTNPIEKFLFHLFCSYITLICFISTKGRSNRALLIRQCIEMACLLQWVKKENISHVSFFNPYEIDSNLLSLCLQRLGVHTTFIPSIIPLFVHNHHLVCDDLVVTSPYQEEEIQNLFSKSISYKNLLRWPAETLFDIPENKSPSDNKKIAFYSHGQWLRNALSRADNGLAAEDSETQILSWLKRGAENKMWEVVIYLHPLERKHLEKTENYYQTFFNSIPFNWGEKNKSSAHFFHLENFGIGTLSTVIFERLLSGRKTLLHPYQHQNFPLPQSTLNNICFSSWDELEKFWNQYSEKNDMIFFDELSLTNYSAYSASVKN